MPPWIADLLWLADHYPDLAVQRVTADRGLFADDPDDLEYVEQTMTAQLLQLRRGTPFELIH